MVILPILIFASSGSADCLAPVSAKQAHVSSHFGFRHRLGQDDNHRGADIVAVKGSPIKNLFSGEVIQVLSGKKGNHLYVASKHPRHGVMLLVYSHLDKVLVELGQKISAGDVLGTVGATGTDEGPHLHLGVGILKGAPGKEKVHWSDPYKAINLCKYEYRHHDYKR